MENKAKRTVLNVSYVVIVLLTIAILFVYFKFEVESMRADPNLEPTDGLALMVWGFVIGALVAIPLLITYFEAWRFAKCFWLSSDRSKTETVLNLTLCVLSLIFLFMGIVYVLFFEINFILLCVLIWDVCYLWFRMVYGIAYAVYRMRLWKSQGKHRSTHS